MKAVLIVFILSIAGCSHVKQGWFVRAQDGKIYRLETGSAEEEYSLHEVNSSALISLETSHASKPDIQSENNNAPDSANIRRYCDSVYRYEDIIWNLPEGSEEVDKARATSRYYLKLFNELYYKNQTAPSVPKPKDMTIYNPKP